MQRDVLHAAVYMQCACGAHAVVCMQCACRGPAVQRPRCVRALAPRAGLLHRRRGGRGRHRSGRRRGRGRHSTVRAVLPLPRGSRCAAHWARGQAENTTDTIGQRGPSGGSIGRGCGRTAPRCHSGRPLALAKPARRHRAEPKPLVYPWWARALIGASLYCPL